MCLRAVGAGPAGAAAAGPKFGAPWIIDPERALLSMGALTKKKFFLNGVRRAR